jgi:hypothetical protein
MADSVGIRKIHGSLVKIDIDNYVGEDGYAFYDVQTGEARLANGQPGGIPIWGPSPLSGTGSVSMVSIIDPDTNTLQATHSNPYRLALDENTFTVEEYQTGNLKIKAVSTSFNRINIDDSGTLATINSVDNVDRNLDLIAGPGIKLSAKVNNNTQSLRIENTAPTSTFGLIIDTYIDDSGDLIIEHADAFDPNTVYIDDDGHFIISTSPVPYYYSSTSTTLPGGGSGSSTISGMADVNTTGAANGDILTYTAGTWNATTPDSQATAVGTTAPASPNEGNLWLDTNTGKLYVYATGAWIEPT